MSKQVENENSIYYINQKKVNYEKVGRWTLGDMEDLEEKGVDMDNLSDGSLSFREAIDLVHHFAHRVNEKVQRDDVRSLTPSDLTKHAEAIMSQINEGQDKADPSS